MTRIPSHTIDDAPLDARVVREASASSGRVSDATRARAAGRGWTDEQLAEAFAYLGLTVFTSYFLNYAGTEPDLPGPGGG